MGKNLILITIIGLSLLLLVSIVYAHEFDRINPEISNYEYMDEMHEYKTNNFEPSEALDDLQIGCRISFKD